MTTATFPTINDDRIADVATQLASKRAPATVRVTDGVSAKLAVEPDHDVSINDYDYMGKVQWQGPGRRDRNPPSSFDPDRTERVDVPQHGVLWWERPEGVEPDDDHYRQTRGHMKELAVFGYNVLVVEVTHELANGYSRTERDALGGVEPFADGEYLEQLVHDLLRQALDRF